eukprot:gene12371-26024_t
MDVFASWILAAAAMMSPPLAQLLTFHAYEISIPKAYVEAFNLEALKLALQGVTLVTPSGNDGAAGFLARYADVFCGYYPHFPASSPYVTTVGATQWIQSSGGGGSSGGVSDERVCQSNRGGVITSGGGFSNIYQTPAWQKSATRGYLNKISSHNALQSFGHYNVSGRGYPDIALVASEYVAMVDGRLVLFSGTNAAAAVFVSMISLLNQYRFNLNLPTIGFFNIPLYTSNGVFCNDVITGDNSCTAGRCCPHGFQSTVGWDATTGFGSVDFKLMLKYFKIEILDEYETDVPKEYIPDENTNEILTSTSPQNENTSPKSSTATHMLYFNDWSRVIGSLIGFSTLLLMISWAVRRYSYSESTQLSRGLRRNGYEAVITSTSSSSSTGLTRPLPLNQHQNQIEMVVCSHTDTLRAVEDNSNNNFP